MIDPIIKDRFQQLPPIYQAFVGSDFPTEAAKTLGPVANLSQEQTTVFENAIALYLLFFIEKVGVISLLVEAGVENEEANSLVNAMIISLPNFVRDGLETKPTSPEANGLAGEIAETEQAFASLQGIRTMAGDMQAVKTHDEPVYRSSQSEILNHDTATMPRPPANTPRWDTE